MTPEEKINPEITQVREKHLKSKPKVNTAIVRG